MTALNGAKQILILGTGGTSVDILDTINDINALACEPRYHCIGFLDDSEDTWGMRINGVVVLGPLRTACWHPEASLVNGIGSDTSFWKKQAIIAKTKSRPGRFETIIHPTASVSRTAKLGVGVVLLQHVTVASNARIGDHVIVLPNSIVSHDDVIGDFTSIAGGVCVSGNVNIGKSCYLGTNSSIRNHVCIGDGSLIGMGSVVLKDVQENAVVVGNPARYLRPVR